MLARALAVAFVLLAAVTAWGQPGSWWTTHPASSTFAEQKIRLMFDQNGDWLGLNGLCNGTMPAVVSESGRFKLACNASNQLVVSINGGAYTVLTGAGSTVSGPGLSTDNALVRWNGVGGDTLQDGLCIESDTGQLQCPHIDASLGILTSGQAMVCTTTTAEGRFCWDTDDDRMYVGNGATATDIGGNVRGPASSTDNRVVRWDGVTGNLVQDSSCTLNDAGTFTCIHIDQTGTLFTSPQATVCTTTTAEGQICWDTNDDELYIGNGATATRIGDGVVAGVDHSVQFSNAGLHGGESTFLYDDALNCVGINTTPLSGWSLNIDGNQSISQGGLSITGDDTAVLASGRSMIVQQTSTSTTLPDPMVEFNAVYDDAGAGQNGGAAFEAEAIVNTGNAQAVTELQGAKLKANHSGTGNLTTGTAVYIEATTQNTGNATTLKGADVVLGTVSASSDVTTMVGVDISASSGGGTLATVNGLRIQNLPGSAQNSILQLGADDTNSFAGPTIVNNTFTVTDTTEPPVNFTYSSADTTSRQDVLNIGALTSANMLDAYGPAIKFSIQDDISAKEPIAAIGATRDGADDNGRFFISTYSGGSEDVIVEIEQDGKIVLNVGGGPDEDLTWFNDPLKEGLHCNAGNECCAFGLTGETCDGVNSAEFTAQTGDVAVEINGNGTQNALNVNVSGGLPLATFGPLGVLLNSDNWDYDLRWASVNDTQLWADATNDCVGIGGQCDGTADLQVDADTGNIGVVITGNGTQNVAEFKDSGGTTQFAVDPDGDLVCTAGKSISTCEVVKTILAKAGGFHTDGTQCTKAEAADPTGVKRFTVTCTDNDAGEMGFEVALPDGYKSGTTLLISLDTWNANATPSGNVGVQLQCQCRGPNDTLDTTFSTETEATATFDTQNDLERITWAAHTPNGSCAGGDQLRCFMDINATATTTTQMSDVRFSESRIEYTWSMSD